MNNTYGLKSNHTSDILPKVSIIVSTYRRIETFEKALQSLIKQTYINIEIIIVDDNANENWSIEIENIIKRIRILSNNEIVYIKNKVNKGSAETRNVGIKNSNGQYVTFLDDDDIYLHDKVKRQVEHMIINNSDFSLTDLWLYTENDQLIEKRIRNYIKDYSPETLMKYHLMYHMTGTDVMMFKTEYLIKIGMFSPINVGDEFYLMQKAIQGKGKFSYLSGCDVKAYVHKETKGLSSGNSKINGERNLYKYKTSFFDLLSRKEKKYITMRHYAVLAYAQYRSSNYPLMLLNICFSFLSSPLNFINIVLKRK